jgi:hypothetical protein
VSLKATATFVSIPWASNQFVIAPSMMLIKVSKGIMVEAGRKGKKKSLT